MELKKKFETFGFYQKRLSFMLFLATVPNAFSGLQFIVTLYTPPHYCADNVTSLYKDNHTANNTIADNGVEGSFYFMCPSDVFKNQPSSALSVNSNSNSTSLFRCNNIKFESNYSTAVTEFGLVCDRAWIKPSLVLSYMIGKMTGGFISGLLSDRFGRKKIFILSTTLQYCFDFATGFSWNEISMAVFMFFCGTTAVSNFITATLLGYESVEPQQRSFTYFSAEMGFAVGHLILPLLSYCFYNWRWYLRFTLLILTLFVPYIWILDDTPIWLSATGRTKELSKVVEKIAKLNKIKQSDVKEMLLKDDSDKLTENLSIFSTFKEMKTEKILIFRFLIVNLSWIMVVMTWYVITLSVNNLAGSRFINLLISGIMETLATFIYYFGVEGYGRRTTFSFLMILTGIAMTIGAVLPSGSVTAVLILTMVVKLCVSIAYNTAYVYTGELFPTSIRQTIVSSVDSFSRVGSMIAPFIIFAGESGDTLLPTITIAVLNCTAAALYVFLPETTNKRLPQTTKEAAEMKSGFRLPCLRKTKNKPNHTIAEDTDLL